VLRHRHQRRRVRGEDRAATTLRAGHDQRGQPRLQRLSHLRALVCPRRVLRHPHEGRCALRGRRATPARAQWQRCTDEIVRLSGERAADKCPYTQRRGEVLLQYAGETLVFVTNQLNLSPFTIAAIYEDRRQIELHVKALKQNLKIKSFVGNSDNAAKTQIWTALICIQLPLCSRFGWGHGQPDGAAAHRYLHAPRSAGQDRRTVRRVARSACVAARDLAFAQRWIASGQHRGARNRKHRLPVQNLRPIKPAAVPYGCFGQRRS